MDGFQRLIEDLPARVLHGRSRRIGEKGVRAAVAALPLANPAQAVRDVEGLLDGMLAGTWPGAERVAALEHLRAPIEVLCAGIDRQLGSEPHPLPASGAQWAEAAQRLQMKLAGGYALALHELCAPAGKLPLFKRRVAATATVRGLVHAGRALAWAYRQYRSAPPGLWRRIHALHAFAVELAIVGQSVEDSLADGVPMTARTGYAGLLLLAISNPYRFSARELREAQRVVECVAVECGLARAGSEGVGVDSDGDTGPGYIPEERIAAGSGVLALDVAAVERMLDGRVALLPEGVDAIDLPRPGGGRWTASVRFLQRLRAGWGTAERGHARLGATHWLDIVVGMHAVHFALSGNVDFANFVRQVHGDAIMVGEHELASAWLASADSAQPQVSRGEILNQSEGGYLMRLHAAGGLRMRMGELVGLAPPGDEDERDWMVGVIRWLRHDDESEMLGLEMLQRQARAAGVRPVTVDGKMLAPLRAVELPDGDDERLSLLVSDRFARNVVAAEVVLPALTTDWSSQASVATWRTGTCDELGPMCFRVMLEAEKSGC